MLKEVSAEHYAVLEAEYYASLEALVALRKERFRRGSCRIENRFYSALKVLNNHTVERKSPLQE